MLQQWAGEMRPGSFYVSQDGMIGVYEYCEETRCRGPVGSVAARGCAERSGSPCIRLADNGIIPDNLRIIGQSSGSNALPGRPPVNSTLGPVVPPLNPDSSTSGPIVPPLNP